MKYKELIGEDAIIGKTVKRCAQEDDRVFIFFEDDTFVVIQSQGYEDQYAAFAYNPYNQEPNRYNIFDLHSAGFITETEKMQLMIKFEEENLKIKEDTERLEYERLKAKYNP